MNNEVIKIVFSLAEPHPLPATRGGGKGLASGSGFLRKPGEQIEPNSMNNIKIPRVQMLAKYFLCEQNFYSIPLQRVKKKMDECFLCRKDLSAGVAYKKRKKLHGESASVARMNFVF